MSKAQPQQGGSNTPAQQQQSGASPVQQQGGKPIFRDWASI